MDVFVIGLNGNPLMPMKPQKARKLLNTSKAVVFQKQPFTIQLLYKTGTTLFHSKSMFVNSIRITYLVKSKGVRPLKPSALP